MQDTPQQPIAYAPAAVPRGVSIGARVLFWLIFYWVGALVLLISLNSFGSARPVAVLLQVVVGIWIFAAVLHICRRRGAYVVAGAWALLLGLPLAYQVSRRMHHWVTIGMDGPGGQGSPMVFLLGFVIEWMILGPLCTMLLILLLARPWRRPERMMIHRRGAESAESVQDVESVGGS